MIAIRKATLEDLSNLLKFEQELIQAERPFTTTLKEDTFHYYDMKEMILSDDFELLIAEENKKMAATGYARIKTSEKPYYNFGSCGYLGFMYTAPEYRGRGINKLIIDRLLAWVKSKGISEVQLDVYADNEGAIKAYEKAGFKSELLKMRMSI